MNSLKSLMESVFDKELTRLSNRAASERLGHIGMSQGGMCARRLAYHKFNYKPEPYNNRFIIAVNDGHRAHNQIRRFLNQSMTRSHHYLSGKEEEVRLTLRNGFIVTGHLDSVINKDCSKFCKQHYGWPEKTILEIKTCRNFPENVSNEYMAQHVLYMKATGINDGLFVYKEKSTGKFKWFDAKYDEKIFKQAENRLADVLTAAVPEEIQKEYGPDTTGKLPFQCSYCPYLKQCWSNFGLRMVKEDPKIAFVNVNGLSFVPGIKEEF